jgi:hypothetical protein
MTQEQVNFSSKHCNNDNDTLAQLIQKLPEDTLLEYTQILSKYLSVNKKRP